MENLNKICVLSDWDDPELAQMLPQFYPPAMAKAGEWQSRRHRKYWEWAIGMLALEKLGKLTPDAVALGVGSGSETPLFFLTNRIKYVMSTDLYTITSKQWTEADVNMLASPEKLAPYPYNRRRLGVQVMNGTDLRFEDNTFDIVFSYSSIEHFGGKENAAKAMREIERVLKPGGVASIATEIFIGDVAKLEQAREWRKKFPWNKVTRYGIFPEMFTRDELEKYLIGATGLKLCWPADFSVCQDDLDKAVPFPAKPDMYPHLFLNLRGVHWGSIHLAFRKQE
ncbi:MAG TPA: class I SAM-dependent methyltransferase [Methanocella sp.]|jgi:SAM-dependent methyltransferase